MLVVVGICGCVIIEIDYYLLHLAVNEKNGVKWNSKKYFA